MIRRLLNIVVLLIGTLALTSPIAAEQQPTNTVLVIGAPVAGDNGLRGYFQGVRTIEGLLKSSPAATAANLVVETSPFGWPEAEKLARARTIVFYFDGSRWQPLADAERRRQIEALAAKGVGIVALHRSVAGGAPAALLGASMRDEPGRAAFVHARPVAGSHPLLRGVAPVVYAGEVGDHVQLAPGATSLMRATLTPLSSGTQSTTQIETAAAWRAERPGGGRSFGFAGLLDAHALDVPAVRALVLNGILWASGLDVPAGGATTTADPQLAAKQIDPRTGRDRFTVAAVVRAKDQQELEQEWGKIIWYVSGPLGNSEALTTGVAIIAPGKANPRHFHPNTDEVLHVLSGRIRHTMNDVTVEMGPGDTVSIPRGVYHNATNLGSEPAVLAISFNTAWREVIGE